MKIRKSKARPSPSGANDYLVKLPDKIELIARIRYHSKAYLNQFSAMPPIAPCGKARSNSIESNAALLALNQKLEEATARQIGISRQHEP